MLGDLTQFECLNMCEWFRLSQTGNCVYRGVRAGTDNHLFPTDLATCSILQCDIECSRACEAARPENEFHTAFLENVEMNIDRVGYHPALAFTHGGHIDSKTVDRDAELLTPAYVRGDLRTMNDVFAGQAGDVVA